METLYTVKINNEEFPTPNEVKDGDEVLLVTVGNENDYVELVIEPYEIDAYDEDYSHSAYVIYVTKDNETVDRLYGNLPEFEKMETRKIIYTMIDYYMDYCR